MTPQQGLVELKCVAQPPPTAWRISPGRNIGMPPPPSAVTSRCLGFETGSRPRAPKFMISPHKCASTWSLVGGQGFVLGLCVIKIGFTRVNLKCELAVSCIFSPQEVSKPPSVELPSSLTLRSVALVCEKNSPSSVVSRNRPRPHTVMSHHSTESLYALYAHNLKRRARTHTLAANLVVALGGSP